jgi:O-antigen/teichoic acid export membrane protein
VGVYEAAAKLSGLVSLLAGLPTAALMPAAAQLDAQDRVDTLRELYLRGTKYTAAFVLPITVGLMVLARPLLLSWLGPQFADNSFSAQMLLLVWLIFPNLAVAFTIFVGTGRLRFLLAFTSVHALLNLTLTLLLVRPLGVLGVVLGTVTAEFVMFPVGMWYTLKVLEVGPAEYVRRVVLPTYPLLLVTTLVTWGSVSAGLANTLVGVAAVGLVSVGAYWLGVFFLGLTGAERAEMRSFATSLAHRFGR